jgi:hypothetical protein
MKRQTLLVVGALCILLAGCRSSAVKAFVPARTASPVTASQTNPSSPSGPPLIPAGPLGDLDQLFIDSYMSTRSQTIEKAPPFVVVSGNNLILHRNGQKDSVRVLIFIMRSKTSLICRLPSICSCRLPPMSLLH